MCRCVSTDVIDRLVKSVEEVADQLLSGGSSTIHLDTKNIAVRAHKVEPRGFVGIRCTALREPADSNEDGQSERFACADLKADNLNDDESSMQSVS